MKVLVVGKGGREHAIVQKLHSDGGAEIFAAPGNAGMATQATLVDIADDDVVGLADFAQGAGIDLTIVGPESALVAGLVDEFTARGLKAYGPTKATAQLEGSKAFAKQLMTKYGIPTAAYVEFTSLPDALTYLEQQYQSHSERHPNAKNFQIVIKADGLAAGKGVIIAQNLAEAKQAVTDMLSGNKFGDAGHRVVIEEFLDGEEFSLMSFAATDSTGGGAIAMPIVRDYKRAFNGDEGPNTGGMGAHTPNPLITDDDRHEALATVVAPILSALQAEGYPYNGVLYAGLIKTADGIKVIEFNVRFGDPETEIVLPMLQLPLTEFLLRLINDSQGTLQELEPYHDQLWSDEAGVGVVLAARGYPGDYAKGAVIGGLTRLATLPDVDVYHMGTACNSDGDIVTNGGRVLFVVGRAPTLSEARAKANLAARQVDCPDLFHRTDIAGKAVG